MTSVTAAIARDLASSGALRASINLGNPVLARGTPTAPTGVTVDLAREISARLDVPVEFVCFDAARKSYEAMQAGQADICFLAIEPAREAEVAFTAPYVVIEVVRGEEGADEFCAQGLEVAAGIRQPMTEFVETHPNVRLIEARFMQIQQAVGTTTTRRPETVQFLRDIVEELKASGFVADALRRANQSGATIAPPG